MMRAEDLDVAVNADGDFDFGLIRPMSESLMVAEGSRADLAIAAADCGEWVDACWTPVAEADIARRLALGRGEDAAIRYAPARF